LCRNPESGGPAAGCVEIAVSRKAFDRAYRTDVDREALRAFEATLGERAIMETA
jgi:hypothetical protein